ncbi:hypothetical protein BKA63DRAFT_490258 [Paraphoma chrysanthemicola]|nr:hypothetical protein BKA63DRAFT_490258 [Paraphoma chrysanthemicola]
MSHPTQPTKSQSTALPIVFLASLTTSALLKALPSSSTPTREKGLVILEKAVGAFMIISGIIMIVVRVVSYDTEPMPRDGGKGSKNDTVASKATNRWGEGAKRTDVMKVDAAAWLKHDGDDAVEDRDGRKEDKKIRKMLVRAFKPKKAALLGGRKEAVVQVDET